MAYLGEIRMFAGNYAPVDWAFCDGTELSIAQYSELFAIIGTTYGGNGQDTFALPDLRGRVPVHAGTNNATGTNYTLGQEGGVEDVTLSSNQIPPHSHTPLAVTDAGLTSPAGNLWATLPFAGYSTVTNSLQSMKNTAIERSGESQSHSNMMPSLSIRFIICLYGDFPVQG